MIKLPKLPKLNKNALKGAAIGSVLGGPMGAVLGGIAGHNGASKASIAPDTATEDATAKGAIDEASGLYDNWDTNIDAPTYGEYDWLGDLQAPSALTADKATTSLADTKYGNAFTGDLTKADARYGDAFTADRRDSSAFTADANQAKSTLSDAATVNGSNWDSVATDPRLKQDQMAASAALDDIINGGGMTKMDQVNLLKMKGQLAAEDRGRKESILQNMNARGMGGSGAELAAQLSSSQAATDRGSLASMETAGLAQQRALDAIMNKGSLSGQIRGQDFQEQADKANAKDLISRFNAGQLQSNNQFNAGSQNDMARFNADALNNTSQFNASQQQANSTRNANSYDDTQRFNAGQKQNNSQFNANAYNDTSKFNAGAANDMSRFNANQLQDSSQFNAGAYNDTSKFNAGQTNDTSKFNASQTNEMGRYNQDMAYDAAKYNQTGRQTTANANTDIRNKGADARYTASSANWDRKKALADGKADVYKAKAGYYTSLGDRKAATKAGQVAGFGGILGTLGAAGIAAASDERLKKNVSSLSGEDIEELLESISPKKFQYKDESMGEGPRVGAMAQDIEKTPVGKTIVIDTEEGKGLDRDNLLGALLAAVSHLQKNKKDK